MVICVFGIATYYNYYKVLGLNLVAFVLLSVSIVAAAFLFIRIYTDNQLSIKEREMLKEFEDKIEEVKKDFTEKFAFQDQKITSQLRDIDRKLDSHLEDMNKKFASQLKTIDKLTRILNDLTKRVKEKIVVKKQG